MIQIKKLNTEDPNFKDQLSQLIFFEAEDNIQIEKTVTEILSDVKKRGDEAVIEYTKKFDHVDFSRMAELEISKEELSLALENLPAASREALEEAAKRVFEYHKKQLISSWSYTEDEKNNTWNIKDAPTKFDVFKSKTVGRGQSTGGNPMQKAKK